MKLFLVINLLTTTALAAFDPTVAAGKTIDNLQVTTYDKRNCKGQSQLNKVITYNGGIPYQMRSYSLSRDLGPDDNMTMWADPGWNPTGSNPINHNLDGQNSACQKFAWSVVVPEFTTKGCHTLANNLGCFKISV